MLKTEIVLDAFMHVATCPYYLDPLKCTKYNDPNSTYTPPCLEDTRKHSECAIYILDLSYLDEADTEPYWDEELQEYVFDEEDDDIGWELLPVSDEYYGL